MSIRLTAKVWRAERSMLKSVAKSSFPPLSRAQPPKKMSFT